MKLTLGGWKLKEIGERYQDAPASWSPNLVAIIAEHAHARHKDGRYLFSDQGYVTVDESDHVHIVHYEVGESIKPQSSRRVR